MAEGWFRDKSDNKLVSSADSDMTPPTRPRLHSWRRPLKVCLRRHDLPGGHLGRHVAYVPPDNIILPLDLTTDVGMLKNAAHDCPRSAEGLARAS